MSDPSLYHYPLPLEVYKGQELTPLSMDISEDGKSFVNPPAEKRSDAYERFCDPLDNGKRGGFDVHVYYMQSNPSQLAFARELWERIRREFPELRIYRFWERAIGPHPFAMFEVNLFTPSQFGALIPWLCINRGPLSVLIHPNTVLENDAGGRIDTRGKEIDEARNEERDHSQRAMWMGTPVPLDLSLFKPRA